MTDSVVLLRLTGLPAGEAVKRADALIADRSVASLRRLLVVDEAAALAGHADAFSRLLAQRWRVPYLICVCVGALARPDRITLPHGVAKDTESIVLWAGDYLGVDWPLSASAVASLRPEGGPDGQERLIELLKSAELFDRVRDLVKTLPNAIASPGIRLVEPGAVGLPDFPSALAGAVRNLLGSPARAEGVAPQAEPYLELLPRQAPARQLRPEGVLPRARLRCAEIAQAADDCLAELTALGSLFRPVQVVRAAQAQVAAAGQALSELRDLTSRTLAAIPADGVLNETQRKRLIDAGAQLPAAGDEHLIADPAGPGSEPAVSPFDAVIKLAGADLRGGESLGKTAGRLAATERKLVPAQPAHQAQLDSCCPPELTERLTNPPALPAPPAWFPLAGVVTAALAGQAGLAGVVVATILWTALAALLAQAVSYRRGRRSGYLAINALAAAAGGLGGWVLAMNIDPSGPAAAVCVMLALASAIIAVEKSWQVQGRAWQTALRLAECESTATCLTKLASAAISQLASANAGMIEALARIRIVMAAAADRLGPIAEGDDATGEAGPDKLTLSQLSAIVSAYLIDLVLAVLADLPASSVAQGQLDYEWAEAATDKLVAIWRDHVDRHGPLAPPPFASLGAGHLPLRSQAWHDMVASTLQADPAGTMWQLCMPGQLDLLDVGGEVPALTFAPQAAQAGLARSVPTGTEWIASAHLAGLLRLVPIKVTTVDTTPQLSQDDQDGQDAL
ncbi:MAG TPA: hypothetical protein VFQ44_28000 [Streptosporangiaceae bacterium]|nr:hypothetical protein [Streptosporangiaceae bacterium]